MLPFSLSISSFKPYRAGNPQARLLRRVLVTIAWTVGALIFLDIAIGILFGMPTDSPRVTALYRYFEYGRSIEGKLRRALGSSAEQDAMIMRAGWLNDCEIPTVAVPGKLMFDIYGMSFSNNLADHLEKLAPNLASQRFAGPGAPPNHSYTCFARRSRMGLDRAPIQILGILASSIPRMETLSGLTTSFEAPQPFTYPRYSLTPDGRLVARWSTIESQEEMRAALLNAEKWKNFLNDLATDDAFYVSGLVQADIFDHSVLGRMIRRAWAQRSFRSRTVSMRPADGFSGAPDIAPVLIAMVLNFAAKARAHGQQPIVVLFEDRGYGTALSATVVPALKANRIDFVATSTIAPATDSGNFLSDGHFVPGAEEKIAQAVLDVLRRNGLQTGKMP